MMKVPQIRAFALLLLMSGLYFMSFFQRVAVPGTIFNDLQKDFMASAKAVTALSSIFLFAYAGMQIFVGILADRHGGLKVSIASGLFLCIGSLAFPFCENLPLLYISRLLVGIGASGIYLCIIKETDLLFGAKHFASLLGIFFAIGYSGGLFATSPFRNLVESYGWRNSLAWIAAFTALLLLLTCVVGRKFIYERRPGPEGNVFDKIRQVLANRKIYPLLAAGTINFCIYFSMQAIIGQKFIGDFSGAGCPSPARFTFVMMFFTMSTMLASGKLNSLIGNRRKPFLLFASINTTLAVCLMILGVLLKLEPAVFLIAFCMLAVSGGMTPVTVSFVKELNTRDVAGVSVGFQNTMSYTGVALAAYLIGIVLDIFGVASATGNAGSSVYPPEAYLAIFAGMLAFAFMSVISASLTTETNGRTLHQA